MKFKNILMAGLAASMVLSGSMSAFASQDPYELVKDMETSMKENNYTINVSVGKDGIPVYDFEGITYDKFMELLNERNELSDKSLENCLLSKFSDKNKFDVTWTGWTDDDKDRFLSMKIELPKNVSMDTFNKKLTATYKTSKCTKKSHVEKQYHYWIQNSNKKWVEYISCDECNVIYSSGKTADKI